MTYEEILRASRMLEPVHRHCESEIERSMAASIVCELATNPRSETSLPILVTDGGLTIDAVRKVMAAQDDCAAWGLFAQVRAGRFRIDFVLAIRFVVDTFAAIECDGHKFHERTKEQALRDRRRDRDLTALGMRVMRFTGREIWQDADACAVEACRIVFSEAGGLPYYGRAA